MSAERREHETNELLARVARADREAFASLYEHTVDHCMAIAVSVLGSRVWAEDCVADTYVAVWRDAARFDATRSAAATWIAMMCRTRAIDRLRRERSQRGYVATALAQQADGAEPHALEPDDGFGALVATGRLKAALGRLSEQQRRALALTFLEGLSHAEIAEATGWPVGTTKSHVRRAIATLRRELEIDEEALRATDCA